MALLAAMRFGRKLALQVTADQSGAPYLSHKSMKEAINKTVRELRLYQSTLQTLESLRTGTVLPAGEAVSPGDVAEIEGRIFALDQQLFKLVDDDLLRIFAHVRFCEARLARRLSELQARAVALGLLMEEQQLVRLERVLPVQPESRTALCERLLELRLRCDLTMPEELAELSDQYNLFVEEVDEHTQYLEINVAGFRKLLKRHEKQIPHKFHACPTPFLEFHRLVTRTSRQLADMSRMFGIIVSDARERLVRLTASASTTGTAVGEALAEAGRRCELPELKGPKGLGPECEMVLEIQRRLKDPAAAVLLHAAAQPGAEAPVGLLYPKPGTLPGEPAHRALNMKGPAGARPNPASGCGGADTVMHPAVGKAAVDFYPFFPAGMPHQQMYFQTVNPGESSYPHMATFAQQMGVR